MDSDGDDDDDLVADSSQMGHREPSVALAALAGETPRKDGMRTGSPTAAAENTNSTPRARRVRPRSSAASASVNERKKLQDDPETAWFLR